MTDAFKAPPDLLTVRQKRGVSLQDIAEATKISASYFRAIENGEFEKLPGGIYSTSYIRQYARAIDYNEEELLEYYYRAAGIEPGQEEAVSAKRSSSLLMWFARVLG
jgi:cytoskeletal protein RodZ